MMPPNCSICLAPCEDDGLLYFKRTPDDERWHEEMERAAEVGATGHPPEAIYFCALHRRAAEPLLHLTYAEALPRLRSTEPRRCADILVHVPIDLAPEHESESSWAWSGEGRRLAVERRPADAADADEPREVREEWERPTDAGPIVRFGVGVDDELRAAVELRGHRYRFVARGFERSAFEALVVGAV